ncbi:hypothetical protein D3C72_2045530 [compost metagenome]
MAQRLAICSQLSPIDRPVRGSALRGGSGLKGALRPAPSRALIRPPVVFSRLAASRALRNFSLSPIGASEVVSTPPAIPTSIWPRAILLATRMAASSPVPQAWLTS